MRNSQVVAMQQVNVRRDAILMRQFQFLKTRQEAFEQVLRCSNFKQRLRWLVWPGTLFPVVDAVQVKLVQAEQAQMEAAAAKPQIQVVRPIG